MGSNKYKSVKISSDRSWTRLKDAALLKRRVCDLRLDFDSSPLTKFKDILYRELEAHGLAFRPTLYLGDEWFSPDGMNAISVPFYLAHRRLISLEKSIFPKDKVEGASANGFMRLLRHEAGHCFEHCYRFSRQKKWQILFGSPKQKYKPESYQPNEQSQDHVKNLDYWYAQAHPEEDFAETFAAWLDPNRNWTLTYQDWPVALEKLDYVDELVRKSKTLTILAQKGRLPYSASHLRSTLAKYYQRRKRQALGTPSS